MSEGRTQNEEALLLKALRATAKEDNLLAVKAFSDIVRPIQIELGAIQMALTMPDTPNFFRLGVMGDGPALARAPGPLRLAAMPEVRKFVYERRQVYLRESLSITGPEAIFALAGINAFIAAPLIQDLDGDASEVIGSLLVGFKDARTARAASSGLVMGLASVLACGLTRAIGRRRDHRLAVILETSGDAMVAWDVERRITDANHSAVLMIGLSRDEIIGERLDKVLGPEASGLAEEVMSETSVTPPQGRRLSLSLPGGRGVVASATISTVENDSAVAAHALFRDESTVVAKEQMANLRLDQIRELEERHRALLDNAPLLIFRIDPETAKLLYINRYGERMLGVGTELVFSVDNFLRDVHADEEGMTAFDEAMMCARLGTASPPYEARLLRANEEPISTRCTIYPVLNESGRVMSVEGIMADVSVEHAARTRLIQSDRLSTLGTLAAGVAHEINNPAAFILLGMDMLARGINGPGVTMEESVAENVHSMLDELRDSIRRIVDIARDLRLFAGSSSSSTAFQAIIDVNRTIESALSLTRGKLLERAEIVRDLSSDLPPVQMADSKLGQVVVNLLVNAAQAIPRGSDELHQVEVATRAVEGGVEISVRDTGSGVDQSLLSRIWMPFFTTKDAETGTGLGLAISKSIVERAGGTIEVESPPAGHERGSRFILRLPASGLTQRNTPITSPLPSIPATRASLLIVEDEKGLARALCEHLASYLDVEIAGSGVEALDKIKRRAYAAILCDLRMPGMSGQDLYERVVSAYPDQAARFIFMTGVGFGADFERFLADCGRPVMEKPFSAESALERIARVIAKSGRSKKSVATT